MASVPFLGSWLPTAQFTGNSDFVVSLNGSVWLVTNSTSAGSTLCRSTDFGAEFTEVVDLPGVGTSGLSFDPAVALDANNVLQIVGQVRSGSGVVLQMFSYDTDAGTLAGPFPLPTSGIIGSDYDLLPLSNGHCYVATSIVTNLTETVVGFEVAPGGSIVAVDTLVSQTQQGGSRYGSVSLASPDGQKVELYLSAIPKAFSFNDSPVALLFVSRSAADAPSAPVQLTTFPARYVGDRLTVTAHGNQRYLLQSYFTQSKAALVGNVILGYSNGGAWSFNQFTGTVANSIIQPVLSVSSKGAVLAYLNGCLSNMALGAGIVLCNVDPSVWKLTPRTDFPYPGLANWLRGPKNYLPTGLMPWALLAQRAADGVGRFYTGYVNPPTPVLSPSTVTGVRGVVLSFDASGSSDANLHPLRFTFSLQDPTGEAVLTSKGSMATVLLPLSAGPAAETLILTVTVLDVSPNGDANATPVEAAATINYPLIPAPVIAAADPIQAARNTEITLTPTVTVSPYTNPTFSWLQTGGTPVPLLSSTDLQDLTLETNGAAVAGETLTFELTVYDGINQPVTGDFEVAVVARAALGPTTHLTRATMTGNMSQRNSLLGWGAPVATTLATELQHVKRAPVFIEQPTGPLFPPSACYLLIGDGSVTVQRQGEAWHVFPPVVAETVLDALHGFEDYTVLLTDAGKLMRLDPASPAVDTDDAAATILLSDISTATYTTVDAGPSFGGFRIVVLTSTEGVLLLQVDTNFRVAGTLAVTSLYGSADVQWVRLSDVESLHTGLLLVGTVGAEGDTFETEYSLVTRSVVSTYDATKRRNQDVTTGELLFESVDTYSGIPLAPVLAPAVVTSTGVELSWAQTRSDLVNGYRVLVNGDPLRVVFAGTITSLILPLAAGATYIITVVASSLDGLSAASNTISVSL